MTDELYIDGIKCDMASDSGITLEYRSNLLTDISKIVSNYSYTIKLPATYRNRRIIKGANIVSANTQFPYIPHAAKVVRDGVEIVSDANAVLLAASQDTIEVALSWGNVIPLQTISEYEGNIGSLFSEGEWVKWSAKKGINYPDINWGKIDGRYHYAMPVSELLSRMKDKFGLVMEYSEGVKSFIDSLIIPITGTEVPFDRLEYISARPYQLSWQTDKSTNEITYAEVTPSDTECLRLDYPGSVIYGKFREMGCDVVLSFSLLKDGSVNDVGTTKDIVISAKDGSTYTELARATSKECYESNGKYRFDFDTTVTVENFYRNVVLLIEHNPSVGYSLETIGDVGIMFKPRPKLDTGTGDIYDHIYLDTNMPDIKPIDLLKAINSMSGTFTLPTSGNSIRMVSFDELYDNRQNAVDWSRKVVTDTFGQLGKLAYKLSGYEQRNWLRYEEDDTVSTNADDYIQCDNKSLEVETDMVKLPFAATDMKGKKATIPIYNEQNEDFTYEKEDASARILIYESATGYGTFEGLSWTELLDRYYSIFREIVYQPKVVTAQVRLTPVDLSTLDMTRPVYIQQVGSYFAIVSIKTRQNNICDVELLKI